MKIEKTVKPTNHQDKLETKLIICGDNSMGPQEMVKKNKGIPKATHKLKILLPYAFDIASSQFPFWASLYEIIVSGKLLPIAAKIIATNNIGTPNPSNSPKKGT